jgi:hypothetical protein
MVDASNKISQSRVLALSALIGTRLPRGFFLKMLISLSLPTPHAWSTCCWPEIWYTVEHLEQRSARSAPWFAYPGVSIGCDGGPAPMNGEIRVAPEFAETATDQISASFFNVARKLRLRFGVEHLSPVAGERPRKPAGDFPSDEERANEGISKRRMLVRPSVTLPGPITDGVGAGRPEVGATPDKQL